MTSPILRLEKSETAPNHAMARPRRAKGSPQIGTGDGQASQGCAVSSGDKKATRIISEPTVTTAPCHLPLRTVPP